MILGLHPKELNTCVHTETCTWMFITALLVIAKTWKYPRCPPVGEWINKLWYIQTMEYYSVLKRSELSICEKTWKKLKWGITEWKQAIWKGSKLYDSNYMTFWKRQIYGDSKEISGCQGLGIGRDEQAEHRGFLGQWNYSVWCYNNGYMSLYISPNP